MPALEAAALIKIKLAGRVGNSDTTGCYGLSVLYSTSSAGSSIPLRIRYAASGLTQVKQQLVKGIAFAKARETDDLASAVCLGATEALVRNRALAIRAAGEGNAYEIGSDV